MSEENLAPQELIERFAEVNNLSIDEAREAIGGETSEEILKNISRYTLDQIKSKNPMRLNRKQRRALKKKLGKQSRNEVDVVSETATKLNYIDLIQKFRELNKKKELEENGEDANEDN